MPDPAESPPPPTAKAVVLLALAGLFAYYNSLHGAFVFDDMRFVADPNIGRPFASSMAPRPVVALSLSANYWLDGLNPRGYHLVNLAFHVLGGVLLFDLVRRTLLLPRFGGSLSPAAAWWVGLATAAVWLVHPLNTQSVTYVVQRCESMMGVFLLAAVWCFLRGATATRGGRWYAAAWVSAPLGVGCKEMMVALPPLLLLFDRAFLTGSFRESLRARWRVHLVLAIPPAIGVAVVFLTGLVTGAEATVGAGVALFTPWMYALTQTEVILHYLRLAVWPTGLALDYIDWPARQSLKEVWPTAIGLAALLAVTAWGVVKNHLWAFPAAWFFVNLAPTSSFVPIQDPAFEHRMYLPLVGVVLLFVGAVVALARAADDAAGRRVAAGVLGAAVLVLGFLTMVRNEDYSSKVRLYGDNVMRRPDNARVRGVYAEMLRQAGHPVEAEVEMRRALNLPRATPGDRQALALMLSECGRIDDALTTAKFYRDLEPDNREFRNLHGQLLVVAEKFAEAVPPLRAAVTDDPTSKALRLHLAVALAETGKPDEAAAEFDELKRRFPEYPRELATAARRTAVNPASLPPHLKAAARYAAAAARMGDPAAPEFLDTLAVCQARLEKFDDAAKTAARAVEVSATLPDEYRTGLIRARLELFKAKKPYLPESFTADAKRATP